MRSLAVLFLLTAACALAQPYRYAATTGDVSLSSAGTAFTIQAPALNGRPAALETAQIYCSVACAITQSFSGTAATATAGTATAIPPQGPTATATIWTASNVGAGTAIGGILHIPAGSTQVLDLSKVSIGPGFGKLGNYTITVANITGTVNITLIWSER